MPVIWVTVSTTFARPKSESFAVDLRTEGRLRMQSVPVVGGGKLRGSQRRPREKKHILLRAAQNADDDCSPVGREEDVYGFDVAMDDRVGFLVVEDRQPSRDISQPVAWAMHHSRMLGRAAAELTWQSEVLFGATDKRRRTRKRGRRGWRQTRNIVCAAGGELCPEVLGGVYTDDVLGGKK